MLLVVFGPFTLVTESADDDRTGLGETDLEFSVRYIGRHSLKVSLL